MSLLVPDKLKPLGLWNSHVSCLAGISDSLDRGLEIDEIAGITGLAFRSVVCRKLAPVGMISTWSHVHSFRQWLILLGIDADCYQEHLGTHNSESWVERRIPEFSTALDSGLPVVYFDSFGFGLIMGIDTDTRRIALSGIPRNCVHPVWKDHPDAAGFIARTYECGDLEDRRLVWVDQAELCKSLSGVISFVIPRGVLKFDYEAAYLRGIANCCAELNGNPSWNIQSHGNLPGNKVSLGFAAFEQLATELGNQSFSHYGLVLAIQVMAEGRSLGSRFLTRAKQHLPDVAPRLDQSIEFSSRTLKLWHKASELWKLPLDFRVQLNPARLRETKELLYQIAQTEKTISRLLGSVASEYNIE